MNVCINVCVNEGISMFVSMFINATRLMENYAQHSRVLTVNKQAKVLHIGCALW